MSLWRTKKPKRASFSLRIINLLCRRSNCRQWCHLIVVPSKDDLLSYQIGRQLSLMMTLQNQSKILLLVRMQSFHLQDQLLLVQVLL